MLHDKPDPSHTSPGHNHLAPNRLALTAIAPIATQGKWRTEAMRSHSSPRLIVVARGQGRVTIAGLTRGFDANTLIFIPSGTMYGFEIGPTMLGQLLTVPPELADDWPNTPVHLRLHDAAAHKDLSGYLDALERELKSTLTGAQRAARYHLGLLSIFVERQLALRAFQDDSQDGDARAKTASARLVAAYTDLIEQDFHKHIGVADYARKLGITPTHLARCCKQTSGRSALALLNDRILFEARLLLRDSPHPVRKIATDLGFGSAAYFTRAFQNQTGMTPSQFRKKGPLAAV